MCVRALAVVRTLKAHELRRVNIASNAQSYLVLLARSGMRCLQCIHCHVILRTLHAQEMNATWSERPYAK